ncbi:Alpha/Beta hydrolase protein [Talaromyces proteolyticus]|uniref:Alpha/Beta hydrolase protein n=1 Tax=Talaromyces proteolyticus TaxID=1131652 RepID=A0AAD4L8A6_9EURO|nr:Alpha/Beta hydrolase protein [Talaromyces proteolyticus]KAH8705739.1 Alpha/Beta hydrolase protein [Talaromyces proteolyticus]
MSKPSIIFIPGSYTLLSDYQPLFDAVSKEGYEINGIHPPTVGSGRRQGRDGLAPSMYDDAEAIAEEAEKLANQGKDVILMGHSYAGVPMSQSVKGLGKEQRKALGKPGGIVRLAYIACLVPAIGNSAESLLSRFPEPKRPRLSIDQNGWMLLEDPAATASIICQELPSKEGEAIIRGFAKHSAQSFGNELTYAGYKHVPASYLLCEEDLAGPPDFQRHMIAVVEEASGRKVDVTSIKAGHCPHLTAEKETIKWILSVAEKTQQSK